MIPMYLLDADMRRVIERDRKAHIRRRMEKVVPWDPGMKWKEELNIKSSTYEVLDLFPEIYDGPVGKTAQATFARGPSFYAESPCGLWRYGKMGLPGGYALSTIYGTKKGSVIWDGPVHIPCVWRRPHWVSAICPQQLWERVGTPYMSLTPMEIFSLRAGTRRAKGDVVVAGLGLGHQLIEVSKRKKVRRLRLIEIDQGLIDWIMPRIRPHLAQEVEVITANVYEVLPTLSADVALIDVFPRYGNNDIERDRLRKRCPDIGYIWAWGSARRG